MPERQTKRCVKCKRALRDRERVLAVSVVIDNPKRGMHTGYNGEYIHVTCPPEPLAGPDFRYGANPERPETS